MYVNDSYMAFVGGLIPNYEFNTLYGFQDFTPSLQSSPLHPGVPLRTQLHQLEPLPAGSFWCPAHQA